MMSVDTTEALLNKPVTLRGAYSGDYEFTVGDIKLHELMAQLYSFYPVYIRDIGRDEPVYEITLKFNTNGPINDPEGSLVWLEPANSEKK